VHTQPDSTAADANTVDDPEDVRHTYDDELELWIAAGST
jgi:hypothetical protein